MRPIALPPRDFAGLSELILARHAELPKRLAQVARYALEHPDDIAFGTAASVADRSHVQPSTLVRLSQALGYSGFSELQSVFRERLRERAPSYEERLDALSAHEGAAGSAAALLASFSDAAAKSVLTLKERTDVVRLEEAIARLAKARTIFLAGQRRSFSVVAFLAYVLAKLGVRHELLASPIGIDAERLAVAGPEDALIVVSFPTYAPGALAQASLARERGLAIIAMTDGPFSPLVPMSDIWLEAVEANVDGFRAPAATFVLAMTLAVGVAERRREKGGRRPKGG